MNHLPERAEGARHHGDGASRVDARRRRPESGVPPMTPPDMTALCFTRAGKADEGLIVVHVPVFVYTGPWSDKENIGVELVRRVQAVIDATAPQLDGCRR